MLPHQSPPTNNNINNGLNMFNQKVKINNIDFNIQNIEISTQRQYNAYGGSGLDNNTYRINATTENENYMKIDNWFSQISNSRKSDYSKDIVINGVNFFNVFLIDYTFNQYRIDVNFSFDHVSGDLQLLQQKILRKQKLEKINARL